MEGGLRSYYCRSIFSGYVCDAAIAVGQSAFNLNRTYPEVVSHHLRKMYFCPTHRQVRAIARQWLEPATVDGPRLPVSRGSAGNTVIAVRAPLLARGYKLSVLVMFVRHQSLKGRLAARTFL